MANGFQDSNEDMSYMVGGGLHRNLFATDRLRGFYVDAGLNAFVMTREDVEDGSPFPGILPTLGRQPVRRDQPDLSAETGRRKIYRRPHAGPVNQRHPLPAIQI